MQHHSNGRHSQPRSSLSFCYAACNMGLSMSNATECDIVEEIPPPNPTTELLDASIDAKARPYYEKRVVSAPMRDYHDEVSEIKKQFEVKAANALRAQIDRHIGEHDRRLKRLVANYERFLSRSLHAVNLTRDDPMQNKNFHMTDKAAVALLSAKPGIFEVYKNVCVQSLTKYNSGESIS